MTKKALSHTAAPPREDENFRAISANHSTMPVCHRYNTRQAHAAWSRRNLIGRDAASLGGPGEEFERSLERHRVDENGGEGRKLRSSDVKKRGT